MLSSLYLPTISLGQSLSYTVLQSCKGTAHPLNQFSPFSKGFWVKILVQKLVQFFEKPFKVLVTEVNSSIFFFLVCLAASGPDYHLLLSSVFQLFCHFQRWFLFKCLTTCCVFSQNAVSACSPWFW